MITIRDVNAWVLDPARTVDELLEVTGAIKGRLDADSWNGQAQRAFADATNAADEAERKKLGG